MKRKLFYYYLAVIFAVGMNACENDSNNKDISLAPINLPVPASAQEAVQIILPTALEATTTTSSIETAPLLKNIFITESSKILLEFQLNDGKAKFLMEDVVINNGIYSMDGSNVKGFIRVVNTGARTRATEQISINIIVVFSDEEIVTYSTDNETITVSTTTTTNSDEALNNLCRTWNITGTIVDLKSLSKNIKAYEEFDSDARGYFDLRQIRKEAEDQELSLSEDEKEALNRTVKSITITKTGKFIIEYTDHADDVADWEWTDTQETAFTIKLNGEDMGNKFLNDESRITIAYNGNRCNLQAETKFDDNSGNDWDVKLTLKLQY